MPQCIHGGIAGRSCGCGSHAGRIRGTPIRRAAEVAGMAPASATGIMHRSPSNEMQPIRPLPTIPVETISHLRGGAVLEEDEESRAPERRAAEPGPIAHDDVRRRAHPPEDLFGMRGTEHLVLPAQRNNLHIAVAAFVLMLLFALMAAFFRYRLQLERDDGVNVRAPATRVDSVFTR